MHGWTKVGVLTGVIALVLMVTGLSALAAVRSKKPAKAPLKSTSKSAAKKAADNQFNAKYSRGKCQGTGSKQLTHSPMDYDDIGIIEPYGIMVDAHVLPTPHGYVSPADFQSARDQYPVYAVADGTLVYVAHRGEFIGDSKPVGKVTDEYQLWFEYSCTFYSYYDLLTSVSPEIEAAIGGKLTGFNGKAIRLPVKGGQLIGRIGGQTVDFAVWDFAKPARYFVNPKSYDNDAELFYLADMFDYFTPELKAQLLTKAVRQAEPRGGKIDYDLDGKLVGNWFKEGTKWRSKTEGNPNSRPWDGHLSISYDFIDPRSIKFSIGDFQGTAKQFGITGNAPDPATVNVDSGLVTYELQQVDYLDGATGKQWRATDQGVIAQPTATVIGPVQATVLLKLTDQRTLKLELFPGKTKEQVAGFTAAARTYVR